MYSGWDHSVTLLLPYKEHTTSSTTYIELFSTHNPFKERILKNEIYLLYQWGFRGPALSAAPRLAPGTLGGMKTLFGQFPSTDTSE